MPVEFNGLLTVDQFYLLSGLAGCLGGTIVFYLLGRGL